MGDLSESAALLAEFRRELACSMRQAGLSDERLGKRMGYDRTTVNKVRNGLLEPSAQFAEKIKEEFGEPLWELWCAWDTANRAPLPPTERTLSIPDLTSAGFLEPAAAGAAEAVELARLAETSTIAAGTLETLGRMVDRFARDYPHSRPELLIPRVKRQLRYIKHLLGAPVTLTQRRELIIDGGWLALLLACLQFDVGDKPAAEASRDAAYQLGLEGGHQELMAWTYELLAWFALVEGEYPRAIDNARAGRELAPHTSAGVQLAVQEAKAWAKLGDRGGAEEAMRQGGAALSRLPTPSHPDHHFVFDGSKLSFYAATVYVWLGAPDRAQEHAQHVIEQCTTGNGIGRWPTRLAVAHIDLGLVAAQRREYGEAAQRGILALEAGRVVASTMGWIKELATTLHQMQPCSAEVQEFHKRYVLASRSL
ncbi:MAG: hypothetical protein ACRD0K_22140 [Egibacteraceae bacterium]